MEENEVSEAQDIVDNCEVEYCDFAFEDSNWKEPNYLA